MNVSINSSKSMILGEKSILTNENLNAGKVLQGKLGEDSIFQNLISQMMIKQQQPNVLLQNAKMGADQVSSNDINSMMFKLLINGGTIPTNFSENLKSPMMNGFTENPKLESLEYSMELNLEGGLDSLSVLELDDNMGFENIQNKSTELVGDLKNTELVEDIKNIEPLAFRKDPGTLGFSNNSEPIEGTQILKNGFSINKSINGESADKMEQVIPLKQTSIGYKSMEEDISEPVIKVADGSSKEISEWSPSYRAETQNTGLVKETSNVNLQNQGTEKLVHYSQIDQEIMTMLEKKGPMEFKLQLEPEDLGKIDIRLKLNEGKLIIDIMAANSKTQALLTSQVDKLVLNMGLQNVQVESINVIQQTTQQGQDSQNQPFAMNGGMNFSQRRQQEQLHEQFMNHRNTSGDLGLQNEEYKQLRYDSHRMDYAV